MKTIAPILVEGGSRLTVEELEAVVITGDSDGVRRSVCRFCGYNFNH